MFAAIEEALAHSRFETARRLCTAVLARERLSQKERNRALLLSHCALRSLGDFDGTFAALNAVSPQSSADEYDLTLQRAADLCHFAAHGFFRDSAADKAGFTADEYAEGMFARALEQVNLAVDLIENGEQAQSLAALIKEAKGDLPGTAPLLARLESTWPKEAMEAPALNGSEIAPPSPENVAAATGGIAGKLYFPGGGPVVGGIVTLGLAVEVVQADAATYVESGMHSVPKIGEQSAMRTTSDSDGRFALPSIPPGRHEFLAVTLNGDDHDIQTRFLMHDLVVAPGATLDVDLEVSEWRSAPSRTVEGAFADTLERHGLTYALVRTETWKNPFYFDFPRQLVHLELPHAVRPEEAEQRLILIGSGPEAPDALFQVRAEGLAFFADLPRLSDRVWALYANVETELPPVFSPRPGTGLRWHLDGQAGTALVETGRATFRVGWGECPGSGSPPLLAVRGADDIWRGAGRLVSEGGPELVSRSFDLLEDGPLVVSWRLTYLDADGAQLSYDMEAHAGEAYLLVRENYQAATTDHGRDLPGAFEFSLREFGGRGETSGRGFLHWTAENGSVHWTDLKAEARERARLQESVPWWIPPCGFGYAMTAGTLASRDYIGAFTLRRGEWVDHEFEKLIRGPVDPDGTPNWELDWPFPEMVGSTISMITAHTTEDGDAYLRFGFFDGERRWGILASDLERNDGPYKEISSVQHKNSSPRLQDFKGWYLDEPDALARPHLVAERSRLPELRSRRFDPAFSNAWQRIKSGKTPGPTQGLLFAIEGEPLVAWRKKRELVGVAHVRARMTLLGRDYSDMYSPVGARPITQWAEDYDLIAASGVFTVAEERLVRAFLLLMGYLYLSTDLMNWRYGSRNANFEADRVDVVGAVGLCFHGQPGSEEFLQHAMVLMEQSLNVYCTPGSGKWYENPACYYLQASKCRTNLAYHLWSHGIYDSSVLPRFKEFLRWGINLLTPALPRDNNQLRFGLPHEEALKVPLSRRIPPIGDHAELGRFVPEHYALMSRLYRESDPEFAAELMWAYQKGGDQGDIYGNLPLYFAAMPAADLENQREPRLASRHLQGFGAVLRENVGREGEFYLLLKQGPGGYRYHRTEGSFMLFADGRPLVYEGGEGGETWRHSTLSFHDVHTPLAPGRVKAMHPFPGLDYVSGDHPTIIAPGDPIFLSDNCHHKLVEVAWQRFAETQPAVTRSIMRAGSRYVVVHDEMELPADVPSHWHLQVVADSETGDHELGWRFKGRFGTDLQVLLPDQSFSGVSLQDLPILEYPHHRPALGSFCTRHLQLSGGRNQYLAVLCPLVPDGPGPLVAHLLTQADIPVGVHLRGEGVDDLVFSNRKGLKWDAESVTFAGRSGAIMRRPDGLELALLHGTRLTAHGFQIVSDGPAVLLRSTNGDVQIWTSGSGTITIEGHGRSLHAEVGPDTQSFELT